MDPRARDPRAGWPSQQQQPPPQQFWQPQQQQQQQPGLLQPPASGLLPTPGAMQQPRRHVANSSNSSSSRGESPAFSSCAASLAHRAMSAFSEVSALMVASEVAYTFADRFAHSR